MNKSNFKFAVIMAFIVTSYISFILVVVNAGFNNDFITLWLRSWLLTIPSLLFIPLTSEKN